MIPSGYQMQDAVDEGRERPFEERKPRILVVDDDPTFRDILGLRIGRWGYDVRVAPSARDAWNVMEGWYPDLIFSDVVMPEVSGFAFVSELRASHVMCPVVLLTAHGTLEMSRQARSMLGVVLLMKPVDYEALRIAVEGMLRPPEDYPV